MLRIRATHSTGESRKDFNSREPPNFSGGLRKNRAFLRVQGSGFQVQEAGDEGLVVVGGEGQGSGCDSLSGCRSVNHTLAICIYIYIKYIYI